MYSRTASLVYLTKLMDGYEVVFLLGTVTPAYKTFSRSMAIGFWNSTVTHCPGVQSAGTSKG